MPTDHRERLARIRRFDQLVAYLRDELGWPIDSDDFEELTFEYAPEELGIDAKNAAKIQEIKRLRPLVTGQPWGIFFVKFEPKRLPVVALRRILGQVALKKRASANMSERQAWAADDLLFVSSYGEGDERRIAFAHFSTPRDGHDLPTLKVLGWDNLDTPLHLDAVARELTTHLAWPDDEGDPDAWRERWRAAFTLRHREVISTSKQLSERLAELARAIRDRIWTALAIETVSGPLTKLMNAFQTALVHDLDEAGFADMYAQTIAYGLLSARITDPARRTADDLVTHVRTNPFLKELMETFRHVGGRRGKAGGPAIDFDELGVSEVVELLDQANMEAVVRDFGDRNPQEDPVIHFYEHFLAAYDKKQKVNRGVFYTPRPVVNYIVRSVDELLRKEFGLADGLADTTTWGEMAKRHEDLKIPEGTSPAQAFVQILDPATGTGTFLVEVIDLIHNTIAARWKSQGHGEKKIQTLWNQYVPKHLLPRLHGYELLMAPYAIAHLKISLKLFETGYRFESDERARVYLTNALEPAGGEQLMLDLLPALAHEAKAVNEIKRKQQFTVVIGNPPYSLMSANLEPQHRSLVDPYRFVDGAKIKERGALQLEKNLQEDYVKFIRLAELAIQAAGQGIVGLITNHAYLNNPTLRGLRRSLTNTLPNLWLLDLHGNTRRKEKCPLPEPDRNVFDIQQGVAILIGERRSSAAQIRINWGELWGSREAKYDALLSSLYSKLSAPMEDPVPPIFMWIPQDGNARDELLAIGVSIDELFELYSTGVATARDRFIVHFSCAALHQAVTEFVSLPIEDARQRFVLGKDTNDWKVALAQKDLRRVSLDMSCEKEYSYRPFDVRWTFYTGQPRGVLCNPRWPVMSQLLAGRNLALCTVKSVETGHDYAHVFVTNLVTDHHCVSMKEVNYMFPAFRFSGADAAIGIQRSMFSGCQEKVEGNISARFWSVLEEKLGGEFTAELQKSGIGGTEVVFGYVYAVLHSPSYRARYGDLLRREFARIPVPTSDSALFYQLAAFGKELVSIHLPGLPDADRFISTYAGPKNPEVGRVGWSDGTVWLDAGKTNARERHRATKPGTIGIKGVPEQVWDFHIGGYQVCHKWLKDRKDRTLSDDDIAHYQEIVVTLNETIRIMAEIDGVIEARGGWPDAFQAGSEADAASDGTVNVVLFRPRTVEPAPEERYVTCVPLVPLRAAAGGFSDPQHIEDDDFEWVAVESRHPLRKGMFVAQVVGKSMEPAIRDGAWCLFRAPVEGTRQGKTVLVQLRDATDPETGQRYTVKRYKSEKAEEGDLWRHVKITLDPVNPDFEPIVLTGADEGELQVVAELVEVLERRAFSAETNSR